MRKTKAPGFFTTFMLLIALVVGVPAAFANSWG